MTSDKDMARHGLKSGPGGFKCRCCTPFRCCPRKAKPKVRRHMRRKAKLALQRDSQAA